MVRFNLSCWKRKETFLRIYLGILTNAKQWRFRKQPLWDVQLNVTIPNPSDGENQSLTAGLTVIQIWAWMDFTASISPSQVDNVRFVWDPMDMIHPRYRYLQTVNTLDLIWVRFVLAQKIDNPGPPLLFPFLYSIRIQWNYVHTTSMVWLWC